MLREVSTNPMGFFDPFIKLTDHMQVVEFNEEKYKDYIVEIFPGKDFLGSFLNKKKDEYSVPPESIEKWIDKIVRVSWYECKNRPLEGGLVYDNESILGILYKTEEGKIILIKMNDEVKSLVDSVFTKWTKLNK